VFRKLALGGVAAALLVVGVAGGVAAQTPTPAGPPAAFEDALAGKLGKTPDELRAAIVAAQKELVARALQEGRLTPQQAERLNLRLDQGKGAGALRAPKLPARPAFKLNPAQEAATFLGVTTRELAQELRAGKSLAEIAVAKGKTRDDLKAFVNGRVERAVQDGQLTASQAARLKQRVDTAIDLKRPAKPARQPRQQQRTTRP
jgi:hypothetical protein